MNRKFIVGAAAAAIIVAASLMPIAHESEPPPVQPFTVWVCCSVLGCQEVRVPADCQASDDLVSCCAPSTEPDGSVGCGC